MHHPGAYREITQGVLRIASINLRLWHYISLRHTLSNHCRYWVFLRYTPEIHNILEFTKGSSLVSSQSLP